MCEGGRAIDTVTELCDIVQGVGIAKRMMEGELASFDLVDALPAIAATLKRHGFCLEVADDAHHRIYRAVKDYGVVRTS